MNFFNELKRSLKSNDNFKILIYLNLIVFVIIQLFKVFAYLFNSPDINVISWLAVPANTKDLLFKPWTVVTYMFSHENFLHILFNLLIFYWFGRLFLQYLSQRQLLGVYILGGLSGAFFYIIAFNIIPVFSSSMPSSIALGASASVMAIVIAVATLIPNQKIYMLFFGQVKLVYLAIFVVVLDFVSIPLGNAGGHIAHLGGAFLGYIFVKRYRKGKDMTITISRILNSIKEFVAPSKKMKVSYTKKTEHKRPESDMDYNARKKEEQREIDIILDKIAKSGYSSLTNSEKEKLFKMSNKK